ncbi:MAG: type II toxin-antitoxin system VapC family toxin [Rhizobiales bacterium]|nr:type II toxin-antitoxin system VapC family toxin [Hyphomicrobiales bacterium]
MIVDTSAFTAILRGESEATDFALRVRTASRKLFPAPIYVESCFVAAKDRGVEAIDAVDSLIRRLELEIVPFTPDMARVAVNAFMQYGKGRGHKAQLNFGDCMAYAASKVEMMPLLFKGDDFRLTDVEAAI